MTDRVWRIGQPDFEADQICPLMKVYPWSGHRRFAYDLVRFAAPERIVELGTHWGTSFFSFCQAVKDAGLGTECIAVDTWCGDEHSGEYGEEVYESVRRTVSEVFSDQHILLKRSTFAEALADVDDESVDVLHIDGLHTYDAVSEDYRTWLPKLAAHGVVLFHDVAENVEYGSVRFWRELRDEIAHLEFMHSWGLGILFPKGTDLYRAMAEQGIEDRMALYQYRADAERCGMELVETRGLAEQRKHAIEEQSRLIAERDNYIRQLSTDLERAEELARKRYDAIEEQNRMIDERAAGLEAMAKELAAAAGLATARLEAIEEQSREIARRDRAIQTLECEVSSERKTAEERYATIIDQTRMISERDSCIEELRDELGAARQKADGLVADLEQTQGELCTALAEVEARAEQLGRALSRLAFEETETSRLVAELKLLQARHARLERVVGPVSFVADRIYKRFR